MRSPLVDLLLRLTQGPILILLVLFYAYKFYALGFSDTSVLAQKRTEMEGLKGEVAAMKVKAKAAEAFRATLEAKRGQIQDYSRRLNEAKASISENLNLPEFMRTVLTEAKRAGLTVLALEPTASLKQEHYAVQPFNLVFRGVYVQSLVFLDRLTSVQNLVRLEGLTMRPISEGTGRYVELEGTMELRTFKYLASAADQLVSESNGTATPAATTPPAAGGSP